MPPRAHGQERNDVVDWRDLKARELVVLYRKLGDDMPDIRFPPSCNSGVEAQSFRCRIYEIVCPAGMETMVSPCMEPAQVGRSLALRIANGVRFLTHLLVEGSSVSRDHIQVRLQQTACRLHGG